MEEELLLSSVSFDTSSLSKTDFTPECVGGATTKTVFWMN